MELPIQPSSTSLIDKPQNPVEECLLVAVDSPGVGLLSYRQMDEPVSSGDWVIVPLGTRTLVGLVVGLGPPPEAVRLKQPIARCADLPSCGPQELDYLKFVSTYYRRPPGQVVGVMMPAWLRQPGIFEQRPTKKGLAPSRLQRLLAKSTPTLRTFVLGDQDTSPSSVSTEGLTSQPACLTSHQQTALEFLAGQDRPSLLYGITGSGKTQVYLAMMRRLLNEQPDSQILLLVPEIGLTQALIQRLASAFPDQTVAVLHSGLAAQARAHHWLNGAMGRARLVVGTRTAILCPLPRLALVVVDEEHDHSYKQQEGLRYSARDLAVWLADQRRIRLILGSATPSLESRAQVERGRYGLVKLTERATGASPATVQLVDLIRDKPIDGLASSVWTAIEQNLSAGHQVLVYANRRGWAPVLACTACGWQQTCKACHVASVLHKADGRWRSICHHCAGISPIPRACPDCGAPDLEPIGRGSQRLEAALAERLPKARLLRLDRDAMTTANSLAKALDQVARGDVDLIIGTQMVAKGHDFPLLALVVVVDADQQLYNPDFRAPEWLLANLLQVAGRAGRHAEKGQPGRVLVQTRYPSHPLLQAIATPDPSACEAAWHGLLEDRRAAGLPPFGHLAAIRFSHRDAGVAQLRGAELVEHIRSALLANGSPAVSVFPPTPRYPDHQAGRSRWQVFLEAARRPDLHAALDAADEWLAHNRGLESQVEVDPLNFS